MRSSNLKHCVKSKNRVRINGSIIIAAIVAFSIFVVPFTCLFLNANAVTEKELRTLSVAVNELKIEKDRKEIEQKNEMQKSSNNDEKSDEARIVKNKKSQKTENKKVSAIVKPTKSTEKSIYSPEYVSLSTYDRAKLERLVEGEAGGLGYEGCLLVAQAIRDSMNLSDTSSIDKIIKDYSYSGSTKKQPSEAAKKAVSYIFDENGYAVNHRVLYFYATDLVDSKWHETQNYITTCGNMRFFDKAV